MTTASYPITLTQSAIQRIRDLLTRKEGAKALRIGIKSRGCSGLSYNVEYAEEKQPLDEAIEIEGATIYIDGKAAMFLFGTEMDYVEDKLQSGFVFRNPNEKGRCGCGESFHV